MRLLRFLVGTHAGGCSLSQHSKMKGRAATRLALDPHGAAHQFNQTLADRQTQAGSTIATGGRSIDLAKGAEQARLILLRDTDTGVSHRKMQLVKGRELPGTPLFAHQLHIIGAAGLHRKNDLTVWSKLNSVGEQVDQHLRSE